MGPLRVVRAGRARRGLKVGFIGGSDDHSGRPGWSAATVAHHGVRGGLTAFLANDLTRETLWDALRARRCYGTTGERIILDVTVNGHPMGSELVAESAPIVRCHVIGTADLDTIEVRRGLETVHVEDLLPQPVPGGPQRVRVAWRGARTVAGAARSTGVAGSTCAAGGSSARPTSRSTTHSTGSPAGTRATSPGAATPSATGTA